MSPTQAAQPHHELDLGGVAPWPVPAVVSMADIEADPGARCCKECGRRLLLLLLQSSSWVSRRVERVSFRDDRSVVRRVTAEFHVPEEAPVFRAEDGQIYGLVPLSVMRRKTLVNFQIRDDAGRPVVLPSLRQSQAITESLLLACADAAADAYGGLTAGDQREVADFVHRVVSGTQRDLLDAYQLLDRGEPEAVSRLSGQPRFKAILDRMADNFVLWVMIPAGAPRRRTLTFSCDEPLYLHYREAGHERRQQDEADTYGLGAKLRSWHPTVLASALGLRPTRIRFPVPSAENTASFHFEIDAPKGVQIVDASLLAGRPGREKPAFDRVGGAPTVGLHVIEVPNGSLSRVQIAMQVATRGWLVTSMFSCWTVFAFLLTFALHSRALKQAGDLPVAILVGLGAAVASFIAQSDAHGLAAHLLKWARSLALIAVVLPLVAMAFIAFEAAAPDHVGPALWSATVLSGVIALLLLTVCCLSWWRQAQSAKILSPWEQDHMNDRVPSPPTEFEKAEDTYGYRKPAMRIDTAEGWHKSFRWDKVSEEQLTAALERPLSHIADSGDAYPPSWQVLQGGQR
jgi:hypothetical protein